MLIKVVGKKKKVEDLTLADVMTRNPKTASMNDAVSDSMRQMSQGRFRHLLVVDENKNLIGIISQGDFELTDQDLGVDVYYNPHLYL